MFGSIINHLNDDIFLELWINIDDLYHVERQAVEILVKLRRAPE